MAVRMGELVSGDGAGLGQIHMARRLWLGPIQSEKVVPGFEIPTLSWNPQKDESF